MSLLEALKASFFAFVGISLTRHAFTLRNRRLFRVTFGVGFRRLMPAVLLSVPVLIVVLTVGVVLLEYGGAAMRFSWLSLLAAPGQPESGTNLMVAGSAQAPWIGLPFTLLLFLNLPRLARYEEEAFRYGTKNWTQGALRSLRFGLTHCLVGVPVGFGLALGIGGLWFTDRYFRGGVPLSTRYHAVYNAWLTSLLFVSLLLACFGIVRFA